MPRSAALCLALVLLAVPARAADAPPDAAVDYAKIYLQGDRVLEGVIVKEDEKTITLKTKLATVPVLKDQIVRVVRSGATASGLAEKDRAKHVYQSLLLGCRIVKPGDWSFKFDPPEPLSDVLVRQYADDLEVSIDGHPDDDPDAPMTEKTLQAYTHSTETKLREKFMDVKLLSSKKTTFKEKPALYLEFSLKKKRVLKEYRTATTVVRNAGKVLFLGVWAPVARYEKARKVYEDVLASFEFAEAKLQEGDRLFEPVNLFSVEKPSDWAFAKLPEKGAPVTVAVLAAPGLEASVRIEASRPGRQPDTAAWAKSREEELLKSLRDAKKVSLEPVGVCGRFGQRLVLEGTAESGRKVRRAVHFLKDEDRAFQITADIDAGRIEAFQPVVAEVLSRFRILNDLLSEGALERGLQAIDACDEGDKKLYAKSPQDAVPFYDRAIALFPRYAGALNNKGIALLDLDDLDGARQALQKAWQLFNEDATIRLNLAGCRLQEAEKLLEAGKPIDAGRLADEAKSIAPPEDDVLHNVAVVYANIGIWYANKDNFDVGVGWLKKALQLQPKDAGLAKNVAILYGNLAIQSLNKGNSTRAQSLAQEALKYDPGNTSAKEVLDAVQKKK
jgi:hypothetical protein